MRSSQQTLSTPVSLVDVSSAFVGSILLRGSEAAPDGLSAVTPLLTVARGGPAPDAVPPPQFGSADAQLMLSPLSVVAAAALMLLCGAVSVQLSLGLHKTIALATLRCF